MTIAQLEANFPQQLATLASGARVALRERGERSAARPSLVLLHGISSGAASWLHAVLPLPQDQHVIAWDAPGYGPSTPLLQTSPVAADYAQ
ncbi:MAG TPA: alpha/beta hydrolase, partial [Ramlibacter sp.]|nr:alpha/beta hydrolase [Ramlibacter sp.]